MYKVSQQRQDWMKRVGSHATRERIAANAGPIPRAHFEDGALPELKDREARLRTRLETVSNGRLHQQLCQELARVRADIKRLNREASETHERALLWHAARMCLTPDAFEALSVTVIRLRMEAEGRSNAEIDEVLSPRLTNGSEVSHHG